jgi:hypothetical protein
MILFSIVISTGVAVENEHEELGTIRWLRNYQNTFNRSEEV